MNAFDHLERQLRAGVTRAHGPTRVAWRRPTLLALAGALVVATGALAASGAIRIGPLHGDDANPRPRPAVDAGVRAGPANTLPLRVRDTAGGPPWTLRAFDSSRGGHCVQVGQVARGRFGVFVPPGTLEPLRAWPGGDSSICGAQSSRGFPIVRGLQRIRIIGGTSDPHRCPGRPNRDCPITSVTLLRYGLLGPAARSVRLVDAAGKTLAFASTDPREGGAYLFAVALSTNRYAAAERTQRAYGDALAREMRAARARGASRDETFAQASRALRGRFPGLGDNARPPKVGLIATFADGRTMRVAGSGRSSAPLPGVDPVRAPSRDSVPRNVPVAARVTQPGRFATVTLTFRAPLSITRFDTHYTATLHGPTGKRCSDATGGVNATTRDIAAGETVRFTLNRPRGATENGREGWCPARFTGEIRYSPPGENVVIGRYAFRIRE